MRVTLSTLLIALFLTVGAAHAEAQDVDRYTGVVLGQTLSEQVWSRAVSTSSRTGVIAGFFTDVRFPLGPMRIRLGTRYAQRGGLVDGDFDGEALTGETRSEWLTFSLHAKFAGSVGPAHAFVAAGPSYGLHLRTKQDVVLAQVLFEERPQLFAMEGSAGLGVRVGTEWIAEIEARWVEGLTTSRSGAFVTTRDRSVELLLRIGRVKLPS